MLTTNIVQPMTQIVNQKDIFPYGDIAVVNSVKELSEAKTKDEIILQAEKWKPYRSLAAYFLWHYYLNKENEISCDLCNGCIGKRQINHW